MIRGAGDFMSGLPPTTNEKDADEHGFLAAFIRVNPRPFFKGEKI